MKERIPIDKQPIRKLQAQYEYYILKVYGRHTCRDYSNALEPFFRIFPERNNPEDFYRMDILDYQIIRQKEGARETTINKEVSNIRAFWSWLSDVKGLPVANIATVRPLRYERKQKNRLTLSEFSRLMTEIRDIRVLRAVRAVLADQSPDNCGLSRNSVGKYLQRASARAGLGKVNLRTLPGAVHHAALALLIPEVPEVLDQQAELDQAA